MGLSQGFGVRVSEIRYRSESGWRNRFSSPGNDTQDSNFGLRFGLLFLRIAVFALVDPWIYADKERELQDTGALVSCVLDGVLQPFVNLRWDLDVLSVKASQT